MFGWRPVLHSCVVLLTERPIALLCRPWQNNYNDYHYYYWSDIHWGVWWWSAAVRHTWGWDVDRWWSRRPYSTAWCDRLSWEPPSHDTSITHVRHEHQKHQCFILCRLIKVIFWKPNTTTRLVTYRHSLSIVVEVKNAQQLVNFGSAHHFYCYRVWRSSLHNNIINIIYANIQNPSCNFVAPCPHI